MKTSLEGGVQGVREAITERLGTVCHLTTAHRALDNRIFASEVLSLTRTGYDVTVIGQHANREIVDGAQIIPLPVAPGALDRWVWRIIRAWSLARKARADIYHFHDPELLPVGVLLSLSGAQVIYDAHEDYEQKLRSRRLPPVVRHLLPRCWWWAERAASRCFSHVLTADSHTCSKFPAGHTTVISNFPPSTFGAVNCKPKGDKTAFQIMYVGGLTRDRGLVQVIDSLAHLEDLDVQFHVAGETQDPWLRQQLNRDGVVYHGRVPWPQVNAFLSTGDVGVVMLQPTPAYTYCPGENIVKLWEYLAVGLPVVISDFPRLRALIERLDCGLAANPTSPIAIADAIRKLYNSPSERDRLGRNGRRAVLEEYNWEREEIKLLRLYERLTAGGEASP